MSAGVLGSWREGREAQPRFEAFAPLQLTGRADGAGRDARIALLGGKGVCVLARRRILPATPPTPSVYVRSPCPLPGSAKFEQLVKQLLDRTVQPCLSCMKDAGVQPADIQEVLLVGGMTRMPKVGWGWGRCLCGVCGGGGVAVLERVAEGHERGASFWGCASLC